MILIINATPTLPPLSQSNCGTVKGSLTQSPQSIGDWTNYKSMTKYTCCYLSYKDKVGANATKCDLQPTF